MSEALSSLPKMEEVTEVSRGIGCFTLNLGKSLYEKNEKDNVVLSGYSVGSVLSMAAIGAESETLNEINKALKLPSDKGRVKTAYSVISDKIKSTDNYTLDTANAIFVRDNYELKKDYENIIKDDFKAEMQSVDFGGSPDTAAKKINDWVSEKTNKKIEELFKADALGGNTALVLANAVYFKGDWNEKFDASKTKDEKFHLSEGETKNVPTMYADEIEIRKQENKDLEATIFELPYKGCRISMFIVLPKEKFGLKSVISKMSEESFDFDKVLKEPAPEKKIELSLPKFKIESTHDFENPFVEDLGLKTMFTDKADFSGIAGGQGDLQVSKVVQKAVIEVNEEGSEAAAASGMAMMMRSMPLPPTPVIVDHPFLFFIYDKLTEIILFAGQVVDPSK